MPNTRASAASTVGREMHMVTAVQKQQAEDEEHVHAGAGPV